MKTIKALAALITLFGIVVVPPLLLLTFIGVPLPSNLGWQSSLSDSDLLRLVSLVAWALWLQVVWCVAAEVRATVTARPLTATVGTFAFQQQAVRVLIGAVLAVFAVGPSIAISEYAYAEPTTTVEPIPTAATPIASQDATAEDDRDERRLATTTVTVVRGETLWSLATEHLGDGERWHEIAALNEGRTMAGGETFRSPELVRPGWELLLPAGDDHPPVHADGRADHVVEKGDTLSQIALDHLGDAQVWPEVFEASRLLDQPIPMVDPDLIYPGQLIDLPGVGVDEQLPTNPVSDEVSQPAGSPVSPRQIEPPGEAESLVDPNEQSGVTDAPEVSVAEADDGTSWVLPAMVGAGTLLAGVLLVSLRQRRAMQARFRRPGRVVPKPDPWAATVERSIMAVGRSTTDDVEWLDEVLRRLAASVAKERAAMPQLNAVLLNQSGVTLMLNAPAEAPEAWTENVDRSEWHLPRSTPSESVGPDPYDQLPPWPLLVAVGHGDTGTLLLNLEDQAISITGDPGAAANLARFAAAEITCNPWSRLTGLDLIGLAAEVEPMRPDWTRVHDDAIPPAGQALSEAIRTIDRLAEFGVDTVTARAHQDDEDLWPSRLLLIDGAMVDGTELAELLGLFQSHQGKTGTAVVTNAHIDGTLSLTVAEGALTAPFIDGEFQAASLTVREAEGCAALLAQADHFTDAAPSTFDDEVGWHEFATTTGAPREEFTVPPGIESLEPAVEPVDVAESGVVTAEELEVTTPRVTEPVRDRVLDADPTLDDDLADWHNESSPRPKVAVLGPVKVTGSGPRPPHRHAFYDELATLLALHPDGVKGASLSDAVGVRIERLRVDLNTIREWFGVDPETDQPYFPNARSTPAAKRLGEPCYQLVQPLVDADLLVRLRLRGLTRGVDGLGDLTAALDLVRGRPFDELRETGWGWLFEMSPRHDLDLEAAIADIGHLLVADALSKHDLERAKSIITTAMLGASHDEVLRVDFAGILSASGTTAEAELFLREMVFNRSDDGGPPLDLPDRTKQVVEQMRKRTRAVI